MTVDEIQIWIKSYEGFNDYPYLDTAGKVTIGYGRNLDALGISLDEAEFLFHNDYYRCLGELSYHDFYRNSPTNVKAALLNMNFNLGITKLLTFKKMIKALIDKDYTNAALEALNSKWAKEVGERANDIAILIKEGYGT